MKRGIINSSPGRGGGPFCASLQNGEGVTLLAMYKLAPPPSQARGMVPLPLKWGRNLLLALLFTTTANAETIAITGATVCTAVPGTSCKTGLTVLLDNGRISSVSANPGIPASAKRIDATGKYVTPGLVDGFSRLGLIEIEAVESVNDASAGKARFAAAFDVEPAINPGDSSIAISRIAGVTSAVVVPEAKATFFGGYGAIINTSGTNASVMHRKAFEYIEFGADGAETAGGSRGASFVALSNAFDEAQRYVANSAIYKRGGFREALTNRLDTEALVPVVQGSIPLLVHAESVQDIRNVIRLKARFQHLRIILVGAAEGWQIAAEIKAANMPVIIHSYANIPEAFEKLSATTNNAARLKHAGVMVAIGSGPFDFDALQSRLLPQVAGNLLSVLTPDNLTESEALEMITSAPAAIFGFASETGSLEKGKRADVVVWDGPPLALSSAPVAVFVGGQAVSMVSRQTLLRDRYKNISTQTVPPQYHR